MNFNVKKFFDVNKENICRNYKLYEGRVLMKDADGNDRIYLYNGGNSPSGNCIGCGRRTHSIERLGGIKRFVCYTCRTEERSQHNHQNGF